MYLRPISVPFSLRIRFGGDGHTSDGHFLGDDGVHDSGKAQLHRAAHLPAVQRPL